MYFFLKKTFECVLMEREAGRMLLVLVVLVGKYLKEKFVIHFKDLGVCFFIS